MTPEEAKKQNAVLPIGSPTSTRMSRVDIDEFLADNDVTNLFLLALAAMQVETKDAKGPTEDWWTFYSLAGIHGMPNEDWAGIQNQNTGYCTHGQFVFPSWHRAYIHQFEQAVYLKMKDKAQEFTAEPYKTRYASAAERFRLPYWDPLMPRYNSAGKGKGKIPDNEYSVMRWGFPKILATEFVHVRKAPDGTPDHKFKNPLYSFDMPSKEVMDAKKRTYMDFSAPVYQLPKNGYHKNLRLRTLRTPIDGVTNIGDADDANLTDNPSLHAQLRSQNQSIGDRMWKLLGRYKDTKDVPPVQNPDPRGIKFTNPDNTNRLWESFACHTVVDPKTLKVTKTYQQDTAVSLESWHDVIHGLLGGGDGTWWVGNMCKVPIAAFDPAFWLHHNNIDRLFALYQALNPNSYVRKKEDTKDLNAGYLTSDLRPFTNPLSKQFYNSADVQDWKGLGFAVPGNKDLDDAGRNGVALYLNKWYDWIAQGKAPPKEVLDHWPKDLRPSYALNGDDATPEKPVRIEALVSSGLATQEISTMSLAEDFADMSIVDQPTSYEVVPEYPGLPAEIVIGKHTLTYTATVRVKKFAFNGTFFVHLFIGDVDNSNSDRFVVQENEIGFASVFASPDYAPCANCQDQIANNLYFEDGIPLSTALYKYLASNTEGPQTLASLEPTDVVRFLRDQLKWRVIAEEGLITDTQRISDSGLEIVVSARVYELPTDANPLGTYYQSVDIPQITAGKVGGAQEGISVPLEELPGLPELSTQ